MEGASTSLQRWVSIEDGEYPLRRLIGLRRVRSEWGDEAQLLRRERYRRVGPNNNTTQCIFRNALHKSVQGDFIQVLISRLNTVLCCLAEWIYREGCVEHLDVPSRVILIYFSKKKCRILRYNYRNSLGRRCSWENSRWHRLVSIRLWVT